MPYDLEYQGIQLKRPFVRKCQHDHRLDERNPEPNDLDTIPGPWATLGLPNNRPARSTLHTATPCCWIPVKWTADTADRVSVVIVDCPKCQGQWVAAASVGRSGGYTLWKHLRWVPVPRKVTR